MEEITATLRTGKHPNPTQARSSQDRCGTAPSPVAGKPGHRACQVALDARIGQTTAGGLVLEQQQLIRELRLLQEHVQQLDVEIIKLVEQSREGQILTSIPGIGSIQAAAIMAAIGNVLNFENGAALKAYFGWAPKREQSGTSLDHDQLARTGTRTMKQTMFLVVANAVQQKECEWAKLYERLVPRMCSYDERKRVYRGKLKVLVRIAGQMTEMIYALLKQDAEILSKTPPGEIPPDPILYDPELHQRHRNGQYRPLKHTPPQRKVLRLPERTT
jgi:Transposase IS116/IS110/IS902 family